MCLRDKYKAWVAQQHQQLPMVSICDLAAHNKEGKCNGTGETTANHAPKGVCHHSATCPGSLVRMPAYPGSYNQSNIPGSRLTSVSKISVAPPAEVHTAGMCMTYMPHRAADGAQARSGQQPVNKRATNSSGTVARSTVGGALLCCKPRLSLMQTHPPFNRMLGHAAGPSKALLL